MQSKAHLCPKCGENTIYFDGICHSCRQKQRREEILNLSADEVEAMILKIVDRIDEIEKWDEIYNDFWALFSLLGIHDPRIARAAAAAEIYCPPELYFGAPKDVRDALIAKLDSLQDNTKNTLNDLLCALAWQGDEQTTQLFYELYQNPRPWRQKLYAGTEIYAQIMGFFTCSCPRFSDLYVFSGKNRYIAYYRHKGVFSYCVYAQFVAVKRAKVFFAPHITRTLSFRC